MTSKQIEYLEILGYKKSKEDGAVLEHPDFVWEDKFVWGGESIQEILFVHNDRLNRSIRSAIIRRIDE